MHLINFLFFLFFFGLLSFYTTFKKGASHVCFLLWHSSRSWSQLVTIFLKKISFLPERLLNGSLTFISQQIHSGLKKNTFWTCLNYFWILKTTLKGEKWGEKQRFFVTKFQKHEKENANFQSHELPNKTVLASSYQYHIKVQKNSNSPS